MSTEAKVSVSLDGADAVRKAFEDLIANGNKLGGALDKASGSAKGLGEAGKKAGAFWKDVGKDIVSTLGNMTTAAISTVTALETISFAQAIQSAKSLDDSFAKFSAGSGKSIGGVRQQVRDLSLATNLQEKDVIAWGKSIGRVTYDYKGALDSVKAFSNEALASNQELSEQAGIATALGNGFGVTGDKAEGFLESLRGMSEAAGNAGGFNAFKDQLAGLEGAMSGLNLKTEDSKKEFAAFQLAIGKGLTPQQAARVGGGLVANIQGNAEGLARQFGAANVYDEQGHVKDIPTIVSKIRRDLEQRYGKSARKVAMQGNNFGPEMGAALFNFDEGEYRKALGGAPSHTAANVKAAYDLTPEAQRAKNDLKRQQGVQDLAREALPLQDMLSDLYAAHPMLATIGGAVGSVGAGALGKGLLKSGMSALFGGGEAAAVAAGAGEAGLLTGGGMASMGLAGGAGLAGAGILASLGALTAATGPLNANMPQIRNETADQLEGHREGLARAITNGVINYGGGGADAVEASLGPATLGAVKQDPVLSSLLQQFEAQSETISGLPDGIAKAVAEALKGSPLNVNVLNSTGTPIHGVAAAQQGSSRQ